MTDNNLSAQEINDIVDESNPPESNITIVDEPLSPSIVTNIYNWIPTTSGNYNWNDSNNWSGPIPGSFPNSSTDTARIVGALTGGSGIINLNQNIQVYDLYIGNESAWNGNSYNQENYTINGGFPSGTLTVSSGVRFAPEIYTYASSPCNPTINTNIKVDNNSVIRSSQQIGNGLIFNGSIIANSLITNLYLGNTTASTDNLGGSLIFNGSIQDSGSNVLHLRKHGNSAVSLLGLNTYSGSTTLTQITNPNGTGLVIFNTIENIGSVNSSSFGKPSLANEKIILGNGTTVGSHIVYTGSGHSSNRSILLNNYTGTTTIQADGSGPLILNGSISTALAPSNNITIQRSLVFRGSGLAYFPGIPTQSNLGISNLQKRDNGKWIFTGASNYTGYTYVYGGILQFNKRSGLYNGNTSSWVKSALGPTGTLQPKIVVIQDSNATLAFNVGGSNEFTNSDITTLINNLGGQISDPVAGSGGFRRTSYWGFDTTNSSGNIFTISNNIADTTGSFSGPIGVRKLGSNTLVLSGNNSYTHGTIVDNGTLKITNTSALGAPSAPVTINSGILDLNNLAITKNTTITVSSGIVSSGNINGSYSFIVNDQGSFDATLYGTGSLTKNGNHTLKLDHINYYTGNSIINGGVLELDSISNSGVAGPLGVGASITVNWKPNSAFSSPKISYTGSGDYSTNKILYNNSTFTTIENNSSSGSISFKGAISAFQPNRETFLSQIGSTLSAWLPADPANNKPNPYLWSVNVFRLTSNTNYVNAETLASLVPPVSDPYNPPETFLFNNFNEIIDLLKVQTGVVELSLPTSYSVDIVDIYWQSYPSFQLNICGSSKSSKNTLNLLALGTQYDSPDPLPIVKTGVGTWRLTGHIGSYLFPVQHKEGTLIIDADIGSEFFFDIGNDTLNYNEDITLLFETTSTTYLIVTVLPKVTNSKQKIYIGSNSTSGGIPIVGSLLVDQEITLFSNNNIYLEIDNLIVNPNYSDVEHIINIGTPQARQAVRVYKIRTVKPININFGSLLTTEYGYIKSNLIHINNNASLSGNGKINANIKGSGNITPTNITVLNSNSNNPSIIKNPGLLIVKSIDPLEGINFHFRFTETDLEILFDQYGDLIINNDLLCLSQPSEDMYIPDPPDGIINRLSSNLSPSNEINLYFPSSITDGQVYEGGFLIQDGSDILTKLSNATYKLYVKTNSGNIVYNGQNYALLNSNYTVSVGSKFYAQFMLYPAFYNGWNSFPPVYINNAYLSTFTINVT